MKKGTYHYSSYADGQLYPQSVRVDIVNENKPKTYRVMLRGWHADGRCPGTELTVQRHKVVLDEPEKPEPRPIAREIRKPYKDD